MNRLLCVVVLGLAATFMAVPALAQTVQCSQAQPVVTGLLEDMSKRLEAARLTNSAAAMRDAADDVQSTLLDIRAQLAPCAQMEAAAGDAHAGHAMHGAAPADPHAGMAMPGTPAGTTAPPVAAGTVAATLASGRQPVTSIGDLRCATTVDPKTAPRMPQGGRTYYFCSVEERAEFAKNPERYVPAPSAGAPAAPAHAH